MLKSTLKIKVFSSANQAQVEKEVNEFMHPFNSTRVGVAYYGITVQGMSQVHTCVIKYVEMGDEEVEEEPTIQLG